MAAFVSAFWDVHIRWYYVDRQYEGCGFCRHGLGSVITVDVVC